MSAKLRILTPSRRFLVSISVRRCGILPRRLPPVSHTEARPLPDVLEWRASLRRAPGCAREPLLGDNTRPAWVEILTIRFASRQRIASFLCWLWVILRDALAGCRRDQRGWQDEPIGGALSKAALGPWGRMGCSS